ncbi:hypothetical protein ACHWQZ_G005874 [Mnemiopsis leidyi]
MTLKRAPDYLVDEDSDDYGAVSSEDEMQEEDPLMGDEFLREEDESDDDFEKEMDMEIRQHMSISLPEKKKEKAKKEDKFYDDIYFNSSDEESGSNSVDKKIKSNDELFYDPQQDEKDEKWVQKKRRNYLQPGSKKSGETSASSTTEKDPATSATLACPSCMSTLCRDCQQHETYLHQFRAMFVFNCLVEKGETLTYKIKEKKRRRRGKGKKVEEEEEGEGELYNPVKCAVCQTKVGVFDKEEIYHFFNVLAT